jgi:hypothetical protein
VHRFRFGIFAIPADNDVSAFHFEAGAARQLHIEFAFRALHRNFFAFDVHLYLGGNGNRRFSNS